MKKIILIIYFYMILPTCVMSKESATLTESKVTNFLAEYSDLYEASENDVDALVSLFTSNVRDIYESNRRRKSRFIARDLSRILDAPIVIQKNRTLDIVDCAEVGTSADACVVISGDVLLAGETTWEDLSMKILLGFVEKKDGYLIAHVRERNADEKAYSYLLGQK